MPKERWAERRLERVPPYPIDAFIGEIPASDALVLLDELATAEPDLSAVLIDDFEVVEDWKDDGLAWATQHPPQPDTPPLTAADAFFVEREAEFVRLLGEEGWAAAVASRPGPETGRSAAQSPDDSADRLRQTLGNTGDITVIALACPSWQLPLWLGIGGSNHRPQPAEHAAVLRRWNDRFGAQLVLVTTSSLWVRVDRCQEALTEAGTLAREHALYGDPRFADEPFVKTSRLEHRYWMFYWD